MSMFMFETCTLQQIHALLHTCVSGVLRSHIDWIGPGWIIVGVINPSYII